MLWILICCQEVQIIDTLKPPSVTFQSILRIENLSVVAKEIISCYGKILVAMLLTCCRVAYLVTILAPVEFLLNIGLKIKDPVMAAKEIKGCCGRTLAAMVTNIGLLKD